MTVAILALLSAFVLFMIVMTTKKLRSITMSRNEFIATQKAALFQQQDASLQSSYEAVWDQSAVEQKASDGTLTQEDLDKAVETATAPLQAKIDQDQQDLQEAHADAESKLAALQTTLDSVSAAKQADDAVIQGFQQHATELQQTLDALKAIIFPQP